MNNDRRITIEELMFGPSAQEVTAAVGEATSTLVIELRGEQRLVLNGEDYIEEIVPDRDGGWVARRGVARCHYPSPADADTAALRGCLGW